MRNHQTMTMTTTLRKVQHQSMEAWPYRRECRGHDPTNRRVCWTVEACSNGKVRTYTLLRTVCSTSNMRCTRKNTWQNTGCCWKKFTNSNRWESSDSEQHNGEFREARRETGGQRGQDKDTYQERKLATTVAHQSLLSSNLIFNYFNLCRGPITFFLDFMHQPITKSLNAELLLFSKCSICWCTRCGIAELLRLSWLSSLFSLSVIHQIKALVGFDHFLIFHLLSFLYGPCVNFFKSGPTFAVFGYAEPCFVGLIVAFNWVVGIFKFMFEWCHLPISFLVSRSLCWSCILCSIRGSIQQLFSALCRLVKWRFSVPVSISFFFCESCSSIESLRFPSFPWLLQCFSLYNQSSHRFIISGSHVIEVCFFNFLVGPNFLFLDLFVSLFFVWVMSRNILRCVDWIIL